MRWLHLSDLHINPKLDGYSTNMLRDKLSDYLKENDIKVDLLLLTGDYRHAARQEGTDEEIASAVVDYVLEIANTVGVQPKNILYIPGNHDLNRFTNEADVDKLNNIINEYESNNGVLRQEERNFLWGRFVFFKQLRESFSNASVIDFWSDKTHPYTHFDEFSILMVNTCLICNGNNDRTNLIVFINELRSSLKKIQEENNDCPIIIMAHHELDMLKNEEKKKVELLFADFNIKLLLCGDAHQAWSRKINNILEITSGCLVQNKDVRTTFSIGKWKNNELSIEAHKWDDTFDSWSSDSAFNNQINKQLEIKGNTSNCKNSVLYNVPPKNSLFYGRKDILKQIKNSIKTEKHTVLSGLSGIGKTQITKHFVYSSQESFKEVFWLNAYDEEKLIEEYRLVAGILSLNTNGDIKLLIERVKNKFEDMQNVLLVFDNADNIEANVLMHYFPRKNSSIIITTQNLNWDAERFHCIRVDNFTQEESENYLLDNTSTRIKSEKDKDLSRQIVSKLEYYPLALDYARTYINSRKISFDTYLKLFTEYRFELGQLKNVEYPKSIKVAFEICFNRLNEKNSECIHFLEFLSFMQADKIPIYKIFVDTSKYKSPIFDALIEDIKTFSVLDTENKCAYMHQITQEMLRDKVLLNGKLEDTIVTLIELISKVYPQDGNSFDNIKIRNLLIYHSISIYKNIEQTEGLTDSKMRLSKNIGAVLYERGMFREVINYLNDYFKYYDSTDYERNEEYGILSERLALAHHRIGDTQKSIEILLAAKSKLEFTEYRYTLAVILRTLGIIYKDSGENDVALNYHLQALEFAKQLENFDMVINQFLNIGIIYKNCFNYTEALAVYNEAEEMLNDPSIEFEMKIALKAKLFGNKGYVLRNLERYTDALPCFLEAYDCFEKIDDISSMASTLDHIGSIYLKLNKFEDALENYNKALELCENSGNQMFKVNTLSNLGLYYQTTKNQKQSIIFYKNAKCLAESIGYEDAIQKCTIALMNLQ